MAVVESEFRLFQMQIKHLLRNPVELGKATFGTAPKRLDAVDMLFAACKLIGAVMDAVMLLAAHIHKPVICRPTVRIDFAVDTDMPAYHFD